MKKKRYWLKSSRFRKAYYPTMPLRQRLRFQRMLDNRPPFKKDWLYDMLFFDTERLLEEWYRMAAKPSPFIELLNKGTYGENLGSTFITKT